METQIEFKLPSKPTTKPVIEMLFDFLGEDLFEVYQAEFYAQIEPREYEGEDKIFPDLEERCESFKERSLAGTFTWIDAEHGYVFWGEKSKQFIKYFNKVNKVNVTEK